MSAIQTYILRAVELFMVATIAFMVSTVFRSSSMAIGTSIFTMFVGPMLTDLLLAKVSWGKFFLFANTDLTTYLQGMPKAEGMTLSFSVTVLAAYLVIFNGISLLIFRKRDIA